MSMRFTSRTAHLEDSVSIEDAEQLLDWLVKHPKAGVNLSKCVHFHTAIQQVLLRFQPRISGWPKDSQLKAGFQSALIFVEGEATHG
ncbi:hypothetical protein [Marinobacter sediminum]|uniref:hypothetical protein n=1 Tax=Marinobacter sediminum TaxID=256323 RepID=UPI0035652B97